MLFLLGLVIGVLVVIFTLQNIAVITVTFFSWQFTGSLSLIMLMTMLTGVLVALLMVLPQSIDTFLKSKRFKKEIKRLEDELHHQKQLTIFAKKTLPTPEIIAHIEHGAIEKPHALI